MSCKNWKMFSTFVPACTLREAAEVKFELSLRITQLTIPFFSGPPLSAGLRMVQWMRALALCSCSVSINCSLWEGWYRKYCTHPRAASGQACLSSQNNITETPHWPLYPSTTWLTQKPGSREPFKALEVLFVYASLQPPPCSHTTLDNWFYMKCGTKCADKAGAGRMPGYTVILALSTSHSQTPVGSCPTDLTFCQPILHTRDSVEETRGEQTLNPRNRSGGGMDRRR